jgi:hypothetical protein
MNKKLLFAKCLVALATLKYAEDSRWEPTFGCESIDEEAAVEYVDLYISDFIIEQACPEDYVDDFWEWATDPIDAEYKMYVTGEK